MLHNIEKVLEEARQFHADTKEDVEQFRIKYLLHRDKEGIEVNVHYSTSHYYLWK